MMRFSEAMQAVLRHGDGDSWQATASEDWLHGDLPFTGGQQRESVLQVSLHDDGLPDETHALAFADFIAPIALGMFVHSTPGSSLTWMIELLRKRYDDLGFDDWRIDAQFIAARDGYTNQSVMPWGRVSNR